MAWNITSSRQRTPELEVLRHQVNVDVTASIVIDAASVAPDGSGVRKLVAGTPMVKNTTTNQYEKFTAAVGQDPANGFGILAHGDVFPDGTSKSDLPSAVWAHGQWFPPDRIVGWATPAIKTAIIAALPTCKFS